MTLIEGRLNHKSAIYNGDAYLVANNRQFEQLLTREIETKIESRSLQRGIPYINPLTYHTFFNVGLTKMCQATSDRLRMQIGLATVSESFIVAPSLAEDLFQDYRMKLWMLSQINSRSESDPNYVRVDREGIMRSRKALGSVYEETGISYIRARSDPDEQKILLLDFAAKARQEVLPILLQISDPIFVSGEAEMDILFKLLKLNKKKYCLPVPKL